MAQLAREPGFAARKRPRQRRSQIVVGTILTTAAALFEAQGYPYVSTNAIAQAANLSIGSIYQYFANRESIAMAVYERACAEAVRRMKQQAVDHLDLPLDRAIHDHVAALFAVFEANRYALVQILEEVPELRQIAYPIAFDRLIHQTLEMFLRQHFARADPVAVLRKCYFVERAVVTAIARYLEEQPDIMTRDEAIDEIAGLALHYVVTLGAAGGSAA